jgi:hypothetical protein
MRLARASDAIAEIRSWPDLEQRRAAHVEAGRNRERSRIVAFEDKEAEFGLLLTRMQEEPEDRQELYQQLRFRLNELKAYGMPLPDDLVQFEQDLEAELAAPADAHRRARMYKVMSDRARR